MIDDRFYSVCAPTPLGDLLDGLNVEELDTNILDQVISSVSDLASSSPGTLSFIVSKRNKESLETAQATACFAPEGCAALVGERDIIPIVSATPRTHFGRVMERLITRKSIFDEGKAPRIAESAKVHPTAIIASGAVIGEGAHIYPYAVIGPGVVIGAGTHVHANATIDCAVLGEDCVVKANATIGTRGFGVDVDENGVLDLPHVGRVIMGDRVSIGSQTAIDRGFLGDTVIGNDVKIDNLVQIAHNVSLGDGCMLAGHVGISGSCVVGKNVLMGGSVGLADHLTVGDGAKLAARAGVMHNVPAGEMWSGIPAMPVRDHMRLISATRKLIQKK